MGGRPVIAWEQFSGSYPWKSKDRRFHIADYGENRIVVWEIVTINQPRKVGEFKSCDEAKAGCEAYLAKVAA